MEGLWASFGIGFVAGLRSMTAGAALAWAASLGRTRTDWIPAGPGPRGLAAAAALAEMAGDKMPFAPDRRIAPSVLVRLALGAEHGRRGARPTTSHPPRASEMGGRPVPQASSRMGWPPG